MTDAELWWDDHLDRYIESLARLVACKSVASPGKDGLPFGRGCLEMLHTVSSEMEKAGLETRIVKDVFAEGRIKGRHGGKSIAVACHGDVVPATGDWEREPFTLYRKEDHLVGRGTTDNKGAAIAVLFAMQYLLENGWEPENDILLRVGSAEEIGMGDVKIAAEEMQKADITLVPDSGFPVSYGEKGSIKAAFRIPIPEGMQIEAGGSASVIDKAVCTAKTIKGGISDRIRREEADGCITLTALGKGKHPATPEDGEDAMLKLAEYLSESGYSEFDRYISLFPSFYGEGLDLAYSDEESGALTAVVTEARGENGFLACTVSIRTPVSLDISSVGDKLLEVLPDAKLLSLSAGYRTEPDETIMEINAIANRVYGTDRKPYIMAGGTYARVMQRAVAFGMGSPLGNVKPPFPDGEGRAHQRNESVEIERMRKGFLIYAETLPFLDKRI